LFNCKLQSGISGRHYVAVIAAIVYWAVISRHGYKRGFRVVRCIWRAQTMFSP